MIGINDELFLEKYLSKIPTEIRKRIIIKNRQPVFSFLETASLYLHTARGEAWGISIMEALASGVPVICSDLTGAKEVVEQVSPDLIVSTNEVIIAEKIVWYFNLPIAEKLALSKKGREVMTDYTEEKSLDRFNKVFSNLMKDFNV
jgi:glycosyltransferase involved in cell wall biosynthesis